MSIQSKPDYKIFASDAKSGEVETFPDILRGWGVTIDRTGEIPPMEWFNAIGKRADEWLLYLTQRGIPEWDASLDYPKSAVVTHSDVIYISVRASKGEQPNTTQAAWSVLSAFLGLGNYYTKAQSDANFQPKGDYATNTALTNGLSLKFDKAGGVISGTIAVTGNITSNGDVIQVVNSKNNQSLQLDVTNDNVVRINSRRKGGASLTHLMPNESGQLMQVGDVVGIPVGGSILWNTLATIPDGFWPNEGRSFSATDYPELAKVFPSLKLPDDRGYAIRASDNGRGKDPGRTVGTYQEDAMRPLTGDFTARTDNGGVATGVFVKQTPTQTMGVSSSNVLGTVSIDVSKQVPVADEFRMKNVSKILITRIK